ncbi:hypothetical protein F7725_002527 [Dissostichus mawsoni]|uniref:LRRCT domain-containing protein n=1 Tax=Dissostichus mawsoni TaxID=36200 RepID=A0A7J5Y5S5_DISMA|nr:hypothetical protein F7725_002527 [Dissostichus mawsoni]
MSFEQLVFFQDIWCFWSSSPAPPRSLGLCALLPPSCSCTPERSCSVLCDRSRLAEIPPEFPCEAAAINLDKNSLKFLSERAFGTLPALKSLSVEHNNISFITPGAFKGLPNLVELKLANNDYISYLHTRTFTGIKKLERLDLSNCNLFNIPDRIFIEQPALRQDPSSFRGMENLTHIYLERCRIEADLVRLENFYLNDNVLADLPRSAFKGLVCLKMLNLGGNKLTNVSHTWFGDQVELEVLYLDRNQLLNIEEGAFENLTSLITLHLNSNNLTTFPFPVFQPVYFLARLFLFRNPWVCDCSLEWLKDWMESYKLVRDVPCASPSSVAGLDLSEVVFARVNDTCVDPGELNLTTVSSQIVATTENRFNNLVSKLLQQELREEMGNGTESLRNGTLMSEEGKLSSGVEGRRGNGNQTFLCFIVVVRIVFDLIGQLDSYYFLSFT